MDTHAKAIQPLKESQGSASVWVQCRGVGLGGLGLRASGSPGAPRIPEAASDLVCPRFSSSAYSMLCGLYRAEKGLAKV